jgi:hypothetical protein
MNMILDANYLGKLSLCKWIGSGSSQQGLPLVKIPDCSTILSKPNLTIQKIKLDELSPCIYGNGTLLQICLLVPLQIYTGTINIRFAKGNPTCDVSIGKLIYKLL